MIERDLSQEKPHDQVVKFEGIKKSSHAIAKRVPVPRGQVPKIAKKGTCLDFKEMPQEEERPFCIKTRSQTKEEESLKKATMKLGSNMNSNINEMM